MTNSRFSHLNALYLRLSNERGYLAAAKTEKEREIRIIWVAQIENEIAQERSFLGLSDDACAEAISDDELLAQLTD